MHQRRFDRELEALIDEAVADERGEVARVDAVARRAWTTLSVLGLAVATVAAVLSVGVAASLDRELSRPLTALIEGTARLGRGVRGVQVPHGGPHEIVLRQQAGDDEAQHQGTGADQRRQQQRERADGWAVVASFCCLDPPRKAETAPGLPRLRPPRILDIDRGPS